MAANSTELFSNLGTGEGQPLVTIVLELLYRNVFKILACIYIAQVTYYVFLHPLQKVPGPFLASFSGYWRNKRYFRGTWLEDIVALHEKYGPVVRIAPNEVSFVDEPALKALYGHGKPSQKTSWYNTWLTPKMDPSFFATTDKKLHRFLRSRVSGAYSMSAILAMEDLISQVLDQNLRKLREVARRGKPFRLDEWAGYFTFDVVGQLALGGPIGFLEEERDVYSLMGSIHDGFYLMANMGNVPLQMFWFNNPVSQWLIRNFAGKGLKPMEIFRGWLDARVTERMRDGLGDRRRDMLQHFIEAKDHEGNPVKKSAVMAEASNILGAGADTTTVAILAVIGALLKHPTAYRMLQSEIDAAYKDLGLLQQKRDIGFHEAERLPFLSAVIKESMRLHPSIPYQLPRVPPAEGMQIGDYFVPSSVDCGISPAAMNRDKRLFGGDAAEWAPERWMTKGDNEEEVKRIRVMEQHLTTFGMGSRNCVGRNIALVEVHKYVATFCRYFDAELVNPDKPWVVKTQWFAFQREFWITAKERQL